MTIRKIAKWATCFFSVAVILCAAQVAWAQPADSTEFTESTTIIETGHLILDGEYIPPPYEITLEHDRLTINGRQYMEVYKAKPADPNERRAAPFISMLQDSFPYWLDAGGREYAEGRVLDTINNHAGFDSASFKDAGVLSTFPKDRDEILIWFPMEPRTPIDHESIVREVMKSRIELIRGSLRKGQLVVSEIGGNHIGTYRNGTDIVKELQNIVTEVADIDQRVTEVRKFIRNSKAAAEIAVNFRLP